MLSRTELTDKFAYIYETNLWGSEESQSGLGSSPDATLLVRTALAQVCREYRIGSLLDLPCGDVSWIHRVQLPIREYTGGDIVPEIVERNRRREDLRELPYSVRFEVLDITRNAIPQADLIFCRDCLVHLSFQNIRSALMNFVRSGSRYLLTTTFPEHERNEDIEDGDWRLLNLELAPFSLPEPIAIFNEGCTEEGGAFADKSMALWSIADIGAGAE